MTVRTLGILGAGKLGITLAQLMLKAGYQVYIAGAGEAEKIQLSVEVLAPGAVAATSSEVAAHADVVVLALPLSKYRELSANELAGKVVVDAMNFWWEVDGPRTDILSDEETTSEVVQRFLSHSRVVKAFNHMGYHDLLDEAKPAGASERKAIAIAGDNAEDVATVAAIVDRIGFDPLLIGKLREGRKLEAGHPAFGANLSREKLEQLMNSPEEGI